MCPVDDGDSAVDRWPAVRIASFRPCDAMFFQLMTNEVANGEASALIQTDPLPSAK